MVRGGTWMIKMAYEQINKQVISSIAMQYFLNMSRASNMYRLVSAQEMANRRKRQQHMNNIIIQQNRIVALSSEISGNTAPRSVWTKVRILNIYQKADSGAQFLRWEIFFSHWYRNALNTRQSINPDYITNICDDLKRWQKVIAKFTCCSELGKLY